MISEDGESFELVDAHDAFSFTTGVGLCERANERANDRESELFLGRGAFNLVDQVEGSLAKFRGVACDLQFTASFQTGHAAIERGDEFVQIDQHFLRLNAVPRGGRLHEARNAASGTVISESSDRSRAIRIGGRKGSSGAGVE